MQREDAPRAMRLLSDRCHSYDGNIGSVHSNSHIYWYQEFINTRHLFTFRPILSLFACSCGLADRDTYRQVQEPHHELRGVGEQCPQRRSVSTHPDKFFRRALNSIDVKIIGL